MSVERQQMESFHYELQPILPVSNKPRVCAKPVLPRRERIATLASVAICVAVVWMVAMQGAKIDSLNMRYVNLQSQINVLTAQNASLQGRVDRLSRPVRVLSIAMGPLHMRFTNKVRIPQPPSHVGK